MSYQGAVTEEQLKKYSYGYGTQDPDPPTKEEYEKAYEKAKKKRAKKRREKEIEAVTEVNDSGKVEVVEDEPDVVIGGTNLTGKTPSSAVIPEAGATATGTTGLGLGIFVLIMLGIVVVAMVSR